MAAHHFWLTEEQFARLKPLLPNKPRGVPRVDDRRVISGIIHVIRSGLMWRDAPAEYGPPKTLYNRFVRWSAAGGVQPYFFGAGRRERGDGRGDDRRHPSEGAPDGRQSAQKGALSRCLGRSRGGLTSKLHAVCDAAGKPVRLLLTAGQVSDYRGAAALVASLPAATSLIADRGYDSDRFRTALTAQGITSCIPGRRHRKNPIEYDTALYKHRNQIERMFGRLKDWRRIATRYDRCAHTYLSAICLAATVLFWL